MKLMLKNKKKKKINGHVIIFRKKNFAVSILCMTKAYNQMNVNSKTTGILKQVFFTALKIIYSQ